MSLAPSKKTKVTLASAANAKEAQKRREHDLNTLLDWKMICCGNNV